MDNRIIGRSYDFILGCWVLKNFFVGGGGLEIENVLVLSAWTVLVISLINFVFLAYVYQMYPYFLHTFVVTTTTNAFIFHIVYTLNLA